MTSQVLTGLAGDQLQHLLVSCKFQWKLQWEYCWIPWFEIRFFCLLEFQDHPEGKQSGKMLSTTFFHNCVCSSNQFSIKNSFIDSLCKTPRGIICWRLRKHIFKPLAWLLQHLGTDSNFILHWLLGLVSLLSKHNQRDCFEHWELFWRALFPFLVFLLLLASDTFLSR